MEIELGALLAALKRLFWLPIVLIIMFGLVGYQIANSQTKLYTATATLVVELRASDGGISSSTSSARQISDSYELLVDTREFRAEIAAEANLDTIEDYPIQIVIPAGSSHINIKVTHSDPASALAVANATVDVIIVDYADRSEERLNRTTQALNSELELMRSDRESQEAELAALEEADDTSSPRYRELSASITRLDQRIADTEARIDRMRLDSQLSEPSLIPIKYSVPPTDPDNLRPELAGILGAFLGGLVGAVVIIFWAVANNVVRSSADWQEYSDTRLLGEIPHAGQLEEGSQQVFIMTEPTAAPAEGIRMLVTGLDFADFPTDQKSVVQVTSPDPSNGKSTVSANLAVHYAQLGKRVVLVDCDLHRPSLHTIFTVPKDKGLTTLITNRDSHVRDVAARVALPGLFLIPSGPLPPNPAELFSSVHFENLINQLKADFDVVILDTPPILLFSDSHRIASRSDAVIAVGRLDKTKAPDMTNAINEIQKSGTEFIGAVWVGSRPAKDHYYYYRNKHRSGHAIRRFLMR